MKQLLLFFSIPILLVSCSGSNNHFDKQAHRGGRGLMPENTIASQKNAIDYDCTMEMDLQMSKDNKIVVSHDAYFNSQFCLDPNGDTMSKKEGRSRLIYDMPYDSVREYDCGIKTNPAFPKQKDIHTVKPLLSVLLDSVEAYGKRKNHVNHYNIEIKSKPSYDGKHYPNLSEYIDSAMAIIERKGIAPRTMIQSFDVRALRIIHEKWPKIEISYLVWGRDSTKSAQDYIDDLGFKPDVFSPNYHWCTPEGVADFHKKGVKVIPWTPDKLEEMQKLKDMGVDGEITDYPNLYSKLS